MRRDKRSSRTENSRVNKVSEWRTGNSDSVTLGLLPASLESPFYRKMAILYKA